jgi:5,10-methylenetetrahydromethanopterin reductase
MTGTSNAARQGLQFGFVYYSGAQGLDSFCRLAEELGAELLTFSDGQTLFHDPYVCALHAAHHSTRMLVGPAVTPPGTRHPTVVACAISTVQTISGGRAFVALGTGDFALSEIGMRAARLSELEEFTLAVRGLCSGRAVNYKGQELSMRWSTEAVPVWIAGDGPRLLQLAGRVADGVISGNSATSELVSFAQENVREGALQAGRSFEEIDIWHTVRMHVASSERQGIEDFSFNIGRYIFSRYRRGLQNKGMRFGDELEARVQRYLAEYDESVAYGRGPDAHNTGGEANANLMNRWGLTEWAGRQFVLTGPEDHIARRVRELIDAGARKLRIPITLTDPAIFAGQVARILRLAVERDSTSAGDDHALASDGTSRGLA